MRNAKLKAFGVLVGEWKTSGKHRLMPGITPQSHVTVEWIEEGAFLRMHSEIKQEGFPSGVFIFGSDDDAEVASVIYFDERGVARIYQSTFSGNVWKL